MPACALCEHPGCAVEHLREGHLFCARLKFYYRTNTNGDVIEWGTTQRSHPTGMSWASDSRPIVAYAKPGKRR